MDLLKSLLTDGTTAKDGTPNYSAMRFMALFTIVVFGLAFVTVWVVLSLKKGEMLYPTVILGILGAAFGGKSIQSFAENKKVDSTELPFAARLESTVSTQPEVNIRTTPAYNTQPATPSTTPQSGHALPGLLAVIAALAILCGILWSGCGGVNLQAGGAYSLLTTNELGVVSTNTDSAFYAVESTFLTTYQTALSVFETERNNRALYWKIDPGIKHTLDSIRPTAWQVVQRYIAARKVYLASPTPENLSTLSGILTEMTRVSVSVAAAIAPVSTATNAVTTQK